MHISLLRLSPRALAIIATPRSLGRLLPIEPAHFRSMLYADVFAIKYATTPDTFARNAAEHDILRKCVA